MLPDDVTASTAIGLAGKGEQREINYQPFQREIPLGRIMNYYYVEKIMRRNAAHKKNIREMQAKIRDQRLIIMEQEEKIASLTSALLERE
jgi:hypothetical protein